MAQHLLNGMEVRAVFQQVRRKGVAQHMGRDVFLDICFFLVEFDDLPKALAGHSLAVHIDEQGLFLIIGDDALPDVLHIILQRLHRAGVQRDAPLFPFAAAHNEAGGQIQVIHVQVDQLRDPDAGGIQQLQHGMIPKALFIHALRLLQK